jgi:hypothetical protein
VRVDELVERLVDVRRHLLHALGRVHVRLDDLRRLLGGVEVVLPLLLGDGSPGRRFVKRSSVSASSSRTYFPTILIRSYFASIWWPISCAITLRSVANCETIRLPPCSE